MKGGTRILEYVITVLLGSIPFVVFVIRRANILGLNRKSAFLITVCLCGTVMLFPWALRLGWVNWWVLSIIILLFISSVPWSKDLIKISKTKDKVVVSEISEKAEHNGYEIIEPILVDAIDPKGPTTMEENLFIVPISELIQPNLNIETLVTETSVMETFGTEIPSTIVSGTIVSGGEYRRSRDPQRNTDRRRIEYRRSGDPQRNTDRRRIEYRRSRDPKGTTYRERIGFHQSHPFQKEPFEVKKVATASNAECGTSLHLEELGVSRLHMLPINEIIDLGFQEKHVGNFNLAASYFSHVLSQDPKPDLAFYLIIDSYWLWNNLGKRDYAITQLRNYVQKYLPLFNTELRHQFDTWMVKENLLINLK